MQYRETFFKNKKCIVKTLIFFQLQVNILFNKSNNSQITNGKSNRDTESLY